MNSTCAAVRVTCSASSAWPRVQSVLMPDASLPASRKRSPSIQSATNVWSTAVIPPQRVAPAEGLHGPVLRHRPWACGWRSCHSGPALMTAGASQAASGLLTITPAPSGNAIAHAPMNGFGSAGFTPATAPPTAIRRYTPTASCRCQVESASVLSTALEVMHIFALSSQFAGNIGYIPIARNVKA